MQKADSGMTGQNHDSQISIAMSEETGKPKVSPGQAKLHPKTNPSF